MPKRKRDGYPEDVSTNDATSSPNLNAQKKLCSQRIDTTKAALVRALKVAAIPERQKHSRRKKTAQQNNDSAELERLEAEYQVLKGLDFSKAAENHLRKTIARVKSIAGAEVLPKSIKESVNVDHDKATLNVLARLFRAQAVKKEMDKVIEDLRAIIGTNVGTRTQANKAQTIDKTLLEGIDDPQPDKGRRDIHADFSGSESDESEKLEESEDEESHNEAWSDEFNGFSDSIATPSERVESSEDEFGLGKYDFQSRLAPPSDESEADTEGDSEENEKQTREDSEESEKSQTPPKTKAASIPKLSAKPSSSTFLPSLTMGGYYSGSESEASDLDEHVGSKKNRRGQRARQKIWEQKYGDKAKHKQNGKGNERSRGWDPKRGAQLEDSASGKGGWKGNSRGRGPLVSGSNEVALGQKKRKRDDTGALHPSWQAAKAAKEKKTTVVPTGKKVVFD